MTMTSGAFKDAVNGRSRVTDGIRKHTGPFIIAQGPLSVPPGSIDLAALAPGAATAVVGSYFAAPAFSTTQAGVWQETPVQINATLLSVPTQFTCHFSISNSVAGGSGFFGLMQDGAIQWGLGAFYLPTANAANCYSIGIVITPAAGTHRWSLALYSSAGVTSVAGVSVNSTFFMTEFRR